jgi:hypothetical protein
MTAPTASELKEALRAFIGAVRRLDEALRRFDESGMPMDPGPSAEPYPWSADHVQIVLDVHAAFGEVIDARRAWDRMRRRQANHGPLRRRGVLPDYPRDDLPGDHSGWLGMGR